MPSIFIIAALWQLANTASRLYADTVIWHTAHYKECSSLEASLNKFEFTLNADTSAYIKSINALGIMIFPGFKFQGSNSRSGRDTLRMSHCSTDGPSSGFRQDDLQNNSGTYPRASNADEWSHDAFCFQKFAACDSVLQLFDLLEWPLLGGWR